MALDCLYSSEHWGYRVDWDAIYHDSARKKRKEGERAYLLELVP